MSPKPSQNPLVDYIIFISNEDKYLCCFHNNHHLNEDNNNNQKFCYFFLLFLILSSVFIRIKDMKDKEIRKFKLSLNERS